MAVFDLIILMTASVMTIVGSALMWQATKDTTYFTTSEARSSVQYQTLVFTFAALATWFHTFTSDKDATGRAIWRYLVYGFLYYASVQSFNRWNIVDLNRHYYDTSAGLYLDEDYNKRLFGGEIIAYAGLILLLWNIHGAMKSSGFCSILFFLIAVALNVVGSVILWNLDVVKAFGADRELVFNMAVSQWITLLILGGAVLHENVDGAYAAVLGIGYFGIWYLADAFILKIGNTGDQGDKAWAGALFCWFSAWASLITARWATSSRDGKIAA